MANLRTLTRAHADGGAAGRIGQVLAGRYRLDEPIGAGPSAVVYLATDLTLDRPVAVKVLRDALVADETVLRRFAAAARAAAVLNHPHMTAVYDWGGDQPPFLVMELLAGGSLRALLDVHGPRPPGQVLVVGLEAARGLDHAHRRGLVHGDLKPANLLFDGEARLRIADFGLGQALADTASTAPGGAVSGTAAYASPEQARGEEIGPESDIYALGLVLTEALTGAVPVVSPSTVGTLPAPVDCPPPVPTAAGPLQPVLTWAGAPDPADRPDAAELASALLACASQLDRPSPLPLVRLMPAPGRDDITVIGGPIVGEPVRATAGPSDELTVIEEPPDRAPRPWGRRRFAPRESGDVAVVEGVGPARRPTPYDFMKEDDPDFVDLTGRSSLPPVSTRRRPRRRWLRRVGVGLAAAVVVVAVGALLVGFGTYPWQVEPVGSAPVPDLVGRPVAEANRAAERNGWVVITDDDRADGSVAGQVLTQQPAVGTRLDRGSALHLRVSLGPPLVPVPTDLTGKTIEQAQSALFFSGLALGEQMKQPSDDVPAGQVIAVGPGTPVTVPKGTAVPVVVSSGPAGTKGSRVQPTSSTSPTTALPASTASTAPTSTRPSTRRR